MNIEIIPSESRGITSTPWLMSRHSFSFGNYYQSNRLGFGALRVLNDDEIEPGKGFGAHPHENMEIVTIVLSGRLEHKDNMNNHSVIEAGQVQRMSAGSGVTHSEFNPSLEEKVDLLQIWIFPKERNLTPSYEQKTFTHDQLKNQLFPIVKGEKDPQSVFIHQEAFFYLGIFDPNLEIKHSLKSKKNGIYLFVISGEVEIDGHLLKSKDAAQIRDIKEISLKTKKKAQLLLIEVTMSTLNL